jgi:hypothetical protein
MFLLGLEQTGTRPVEQQNHGGPHSADDTQSVPVRLPIRRVVEKKAAVEQPGYGLMCGESKKSRCRVDYMQNARCKRRVVRVHRFQDCAELTP